MCTVNSPVGAGRTLEFACTVKLPRRSRHGTRARLRAGAGCWGLCMWTRGCTAESESCPGPEAVREDSMEEGAFRPRLKAVCSAAQLHGEERGVQSHTEGVCRNRLSFGKEQYMDVARVGMVNRSCQENWPEPWLA
ncbi:hypothetical protein HJG60_011113 [Phyllostomus discolor]|uniref:Uncharacterized protein n=1 Tax=Phyllostomus discolor TaxID=89673 RepID=A0A834A1Y1_9CHIR|nr:hypothetical protein HJG60_011113 [Phyllostomus discolor]